MDNAAFHKMCYGMYIISSRKGDSYNGQIAISIFRATSTPPILTLSINKTNLTHEYIQASRKFSVSILAKTAPLALIELFGYKSGREVNKFDNISFKMGVLDVPIVLDHVVAYMEAKVIDVRDCITHNLFIADIVESKLVSDEEPTHYLCLLSGNQRRTISPKCLHLGGRKD